MENNLSHQQLNQRLKQIDAHYSAMLSDMRSWIDQPEMNLWSEDHSETVASRMAMAEQLGGEAIRIYQSMPASERNSNENRMQREKIEATMKELVELLGRLGDAAKTAQTELMPQLRVEIEASRMVTAYASGQND